MREDVGRVTQKYPGQGENGSVYNHAGAFYVWALYGISEADRAYKILRQMIPGPSEEDYLQRGQLPVYIPNYYRGGYKLYPRTAGRSSQLFNTGTVSWVYRALVEGLCGLKGTRDGLSVKPLLPKEWDGIKVSRLFRGATFEVSVKRGDGKNVKVVVDGKEVEGGVIKGIESGKTYKVEVDVPRE
jgi:cellobionic acid phosphorylase